MTDAALLVRDIVDTHHAYLRRVFPEISALLRKLDSEDPAWETLRRAYEALRGELEPHMFKEERILFPMIEQAAARGAVLPFEGPVMQMMFEHRQAEGVLEQIRQEAARLKEDGRLEGDEARDAARRLEELEADLREHIRREDEELFPMVMPQRRQAMA